MPEIQEEDDYSSIPELSSPAPSPEEFLEIFYDHLPKSRDAGQFLAIDYTDRLLCEGRFKDCDRMLELIDFNRMLSRTRRAFLMIAHGATDKISNYGMAYEKALQLLISERGKETAEKMLHTLRP